MLNTSKMCKRSKEQDTLSDDTAFTANKSSCLLIFKRACPEQHKQHLLITQTQGEWVCLGRTNQNCMYLLPQGVWNEMKDQHTVFFFFVPVSISLNAAHMYVVSLGPVGTWIFRTSFSSRAVLFVSVFVLTLQLQDQHRKGVFQSVITWSLTAVTVSFTACRTVRAPCGAHKTRIARHSHPLHPPASCLIDKEENA